MVSRRAASGAPRGARRSRAGCARAEVVHVQADRLGNPRAGAVEQLQQGPVPQRRSVGPSARPSTAPPPRSAVPPPAPRWPGAACRGGAGGRTPLAGSDPASPSATANACSPRTATTARPAELAASGRCSPSPSRSPARNAATSSVVTSPITVRPRAASGRGVPEQVPPVGLQRVRGQAALHRQMVEIPADRPGHTGQFGTAQLSTSLTGDGGQAVRLGHRLAGQRALVGVQARGERRVGRAARPASPGWPAPPRRAG